jgi:type I restriction enzyme, S subunit
VKAYPEYRDSGIEWLGEVPRHWELKPLKYLLKDGPDGIKIGPFGSSLKAEFIRDSGFKVYGQENIINDDFSAGNRFIDKNKFVELSAYEIFPGDVIVTMMGTTGKSKVVPNGIGQGIMDSHLIRMRTNGETRPVFGSMLLNDSYYLYTQIKQNSKGSIMEGLNSSIIKSLVIAMPPDNEQQSITSYLDRKTRQIDDLIEKKRRMIELLKEERAAVINNAVTKGLDPRAKMKDSGIEWLGKVPAGWGVKRMGFLTSVKARLGWKGLKASEYVDEGYIFLSTPNIKEKYIDFENVNYISAERYFESPEIMLQAGDVLLAKDGSTLGTANVVRTLPAPATVNSSIAVIRPNDGEILDSIFLLFFVQSYFTQNIIQRIKGGMGVPHLFQEDLRNFIVLLPPLEEQRSIARYLEEKVGRVDYLMEQEEKAISFLQEYRTALISEVVTGKIDVRGEA